MDDRSWMYRRLVPGVKGITTEFREGVKRFVTFVCGDNLDRNLGVIRCPCAKCKNLKFQEAHLVRTHLYQEGFVSNYYNWTCHGEPFIPDAASSTNSTIFASGVEREVTDVSSNPFKETVLDFDGPSLHVEPDAPSIGESPNPTTQKHRDMIRAADKPLWDGCKESQSSVTARLLAIKSEHNISEKCFDDFVRLLKDVLPSGSNLPDEFYGTKKLAAGFGLPVLKVDEHVSTKTRNIGRNDDCGEHSSPEPVLSICNYPGKFSKSRVKFRYLDDNELIAATNCVLLNCEEVEPYIKLFSEDMSSTYPMLTEEQVERNVSRDFARWFKDYALCSSNGVPTLLKNLAWGPKRGVKSCSIYWVNGYKFHTHDHSVGKATINSGVYVKSKNNSDDAEGDYYGTLKDIIELELVGLPIQTVVLFKCDWFDTTSKNGVRVHPKYKLVDVSHKKRYKMFDPFVLAQQVLQVSYTP